MPATKLAELGYCETRLVLASQLGPRATRQQAAAQEAGKLEHARFDREARRAHNAPVAPSRDKRCFIASCIYGVDDPRTEEFRQWRDHYLLKTGFGCGLVHAYYAVSPTIVWFVERLPAMQRAARRLLEWIRQRLPQEQAQGREHENDTHQVRDAPNPGH